LEKEGVPGVVYLHPRDFAPDCPRVSMFLFRKFKTYYNLSSTREKLEMLLIEFNFVPCEEVLKDWFEVDLLDEVYEDAYSYVIEI